MAPRSKGRGRTQADLTLKITLAGNPGVGKTSLTRRFATNKFEERYISTLGTKLSSKEFAADDPSRPRTSATGSAAIWDIMGNHQFRELLKDAFFMNAAWGLRPLPSPFITCARHRAGPGPRQVRRPSLLADDRRRWFSSS